MRGTGIVAAVVLGVGAFGCTDAFAAQRYAAPGGTGTTCSSAAPCSLTTALTGTGVAAGDEVILAAGDYGSLAHPMTTAIERVQSVNLHGASSTARPRLWFSVTDATSDNPALLLDANGSTVRDLEVRNLATAAGSQALGLVGQSTTVDHVLASSAGVTNATTGLASAALSVTATATVLNSVAIATNPQAAQDPYSGPAMFVQGTSPAGAPPTGVLRNDTIVAPPGTDLQSALELQGANSHAHKMSVVNTLVQGAVLATGNAMTITFSHDVAINFVCDGGQICSTDSTDATGGGSLVDPLNGDVRQKPDSVLTIDKGTAVVPELTDFGGQARTMGPATDIGADEIAPFAVPLLTNVDHVTAHSATVHGTIDPGPVAVMSYRLEYGANAFDQHVDGTAALTPGGGAQPVTFDLAGLSPATQFTARLVAINERGTQTSATKKFTTDAPRPVVSAFAVKPGRFAVGAAPTPVSSRSRHHRLPRGAKISYTASEAGSVRISFRRIPAGRKPKALTRLAKTGPNTVKFTGRIGRKALAPGRYVAKIVETTPGAPKSSRAAKAHFKIVKP
jgi:hypothetical protein